MKKLLALLCGALVFFASGSALADDDPQPLPSPHVRLTTGPGTLFAPNGIKYLLPQGTHILNEDTYLTVEKEMKRLQEQEVRLKAENKVLSGDDGIGWKSVAVVLLSGIALGYTINHFAE